MPHLFKCSDSTCEFFVIADSFGYAELAWRMAMADADGVDVDDASSPVMITLVADETEVILASVGCGESPEPAAKDPEVQPDPRLNCDWAAPLDLPDGDYTWVGSTLAGPSFAIVNAVRFWKSFVPPKHEGTYRVVNGVGTGIAIKKA